MKKLCSDLEAQYQEMDELVTPLDKNEWYMETPFDHWTIFDQVAHIALFDHESLVAIEEPDRFTERAKRIMEIIRSGKDWPEHFNPLLGNQEPEELLAHWRCIRNRLLGRLRIMAPGDRISWYGPNMGTRSFATARMMETWAHAQDVFDTLQKKRTNSARLCHVAHLGVTTFRWSFGIRGMEAPEISLRVELASPSGEHWEWGEPEARNRVWGSAEEFCLVVTQRRNVADTRLKYHGEHAGRWLSMAQAFAGIAQEPPAPGVRKMDY